MDDTFYGSEGVLPSIMTKHELHIFPNRRLTLEMHIYKALSNTGAYHEKELMQSNISDYK